MRRLLWLLAFELVLLCSCTVGPNRVWTARDAALEAAGVTLLAADYAQTRMIVGDPEGPGEANRMVGAVGPNVYFAAVTGAHLAISRALPRPYRSIWQSVVIGLEVEAVSINAQWGYPLW